jgi:hypothetical protein
MVRKPKGIAGEDKRAIFGRGVFCAFEGALNPVRKIFAAFSQEFRRFQDLMLVSAVSPFCSVRPSGASWERSILPAGVAREREKMQQARMPALPGG